MYNPLPNNTVLTQQSLETASPRLFIVSKASMSSFSHTLQETRITCLRMNRQHYRFSSLTVPIHTYSKESFPRDKSDLLCLFFVIGWNWPAVFKRNWDSKFKVGNIKVSLVMAVCKRFEEKNVSRLSLAASKQEDAFFLLDSKY